MVEAKSGGVTSETNQGISLGLNDRVKFDSCRKSVHALEDNLRRVGCVCHKEISEYEVCEQLQRAFKC